MARCFFRHHLYRSNSTPHWEGDVDSIENGQGALTAEARGKHAFPGETYYLLASLYMALVEEASTIDSQWISYAT